MSSDLELIEKTVVHALSGKDAHVEARNTFEGLDWQVAGTRPDGAPYSILQLLNHVIFWQDWVVSWIDGGDPKIPEHASGSWPGSVAPSSPEDWEEAVGRFAHGLDQLIRRSKTDLLSKPRTKSRLEMLQTIASHNSYHLGQVVLLRQMLGAWPPPSGGLTW